MRKYKAQFAIAAIAAMGTGAMYGLKASSMHPMEAMVLATAVIVCMLVAIIEVCTD